MTVEVNPETGELTYDIWLKCGTMMVNRDALGADNPDQTYNYIKAAGFEPEDYGIKHPYTEMFENKTRDQLISEIIELRREIEALARYL